MLIDEMRRRQPFLFFEVMDSRSLQYRNGSFDVVVEKGMLDGIFLDGFMPAVSAVRENPQGAQPWRIAPQFDSLRETRHHGSCARRGFMGLPDVRGT